MKSGGKRKLKNLFFCENRKNEDAAGIGSILFATLTSDMRRGRAETAPTSSSLTKPSRSRSSVRIGFIVTVFLVCWMPEEEREKEKNI